MHAQQDPFQFRKTSRLDKTPLTTKRVVTASACEVVLYGITGIEVRPHNWAQGSLPARAVVSNFE
jgi:hypothetical protein